jgi:hypothetical protein
MGQAKVRRAMRQGIVYHHTSTLRTNLLWMSGVIEVEGKSPSVIHPNIGEIGINPLFRRPMTDFPAVAWFTSQIEVPKCLMTMKIYTENKTTGEREETSLGADAANVLALNRIALGFPTSTPGLMPWPTYRGYNTPEGRDLNETAIAAGDNPDHWYVSESPIDILHSTEVLSSASIIKPKMRRLDWYLAEVHRMVKMCRETKGVRIPPTWLTTKQATRLGEIVGVPIKSAD